MDVLIDSNVILDIVTEVSVGFNKIEEVQEVLSPVYFRRLHLPWEAAFLAGKCFALYKKGGVREDPPFRIFILEPMPQSPGWL